MLRQKATSRRACISVYYSDAGTSVYYSDAVTSVYYSDAVTSVYYSDDGTSVYYSDAGTSAQPKRTKFPSRTLFGKVQCTRQFPRKLLVCKTVSKLVKFSPFPGGFQE